MKIFGLVEMTSGLVHLGYSLSQGQAGKLNFFVPWFSLKKIHLFKYTILKFEPLSIYKKNHFVNNMECCRCMRMNEKSHKFFSNVCSGKTFILPVLLVLGILSSITVPKFSTRINNTCFCNCCLAATSRITK